MECKLIQWYMNSNPLWTGFSQCSKPICESILSLLSQSQTSVFQLPTLFNFFKNVVWVRLFPTQYFQHLSVVLHSKTKIFTPPVSISGEGGKVQALKQTRNLSIGYQQSIITFNFSSHFSCKPIFTTMTFNITAYYLALKSHKIYNQQKVIISPNKLIL